MDPHAVYSHTVFTEVSLNVMRLFVHIIGYFIKNIVHNVKVATNIYNFQMILQHLCNHFIRLGFSFFHMMNTLYI